MSAGTGEIRSLTALRGIAAMAVVIEHFSATAEHHAAVPIPSLVAHGYLAVDLFFVLSGFIMAYTYLAAFEADGLGALPGFLSKRIARIVPLNTAVLACLMVAGWLSSLIIGRNVLFQSNNLPFDLLANLLMLQGLGIGTNLNAPSWTISTEFAAYLIFPVLIGLVFNRRLPLRVATIVVALIGLCVIATMQRKLGLDTATIGQGIGRCLTEFTLGLGVYAVFRRRAALPWIGNDGVVLAAALASGVFLLLRIDLLSVLPFPLLILSLACNTGVASRWLSSRVPYFLGVISYSIYLIHSPFRPLELELVRWLHPAPLSLSMALGFAIAGSVSIIPFAWFAYNAVERPGRSLVRRILAGS